MRIGSWSKQIIEHEKEVKALKEKAIKEQELNAGRA
jgi:hypothetical protein